ncbi:MAG: hypothetical protein IKE58_00245 [Blautia sp.]|nr:hypothetical protein [Blautia sp.]
MNKPQTMKKVIALALALCMVFGSIPNFGLASFGVKETIAAEDDNGLAILLALTPQEVESVAGDSEEAEPSEAVDVVPAADASTPEEAVYNEPAYGDTAAQEPEINEESYEEAPAQEPDHKTGLSEGKAVIEEIYEEKSSEGKAIIEEIYDEVPSEETLPEEEPVQEAGADESIPGVAPTEEVGVEENVPEEDPAQETGIEESGSEEESAQETGIEESGFEEESAQETGIEESGSEEEPAQETGIEESGSEEEPAQETGIEESGSEEEPAQETGIEETGSEEEPAQETGIEETGSEEEPAKETVAEETVPGEEPTEEAAAEETVPGEEPTEEAASEEQAPEAEPGQETGAEAVKSDETAKGQEPSEQTLPEEKEDQTIEGTAHEEPGTQEESAGEEEPEKTAAEEKALPGAQNEFDVSMTLAAKPVYTETVSQSTKGGEGSEPDLAAETASDAVADTASVTDQPKDENPREAEEGQKALDTLLKVAAGNDSAGNNTNQNTSGTNNNNTANAQPAERTSLLQQMIKEKLSTLTSSTNELTITLAKNTSYDGDVTIEKTSEMTNLADNFTLKIIAADAAPAEDGADYAGEGDGKTVVGGNLNIKGMNVLLRGVAIALGKKITVEKAEMTYEGTAKDQTLDVQVNNGGTANITTYGGKDKVNVTMDGNAVAAKVDTGAGDDTVTVTSVGGSTDIKTGAGKDNLLLKALSGAGKSTVDMGAGNDSVEATVASFKGVTISGGEGDDKVSLDVQYGAGEITVNGDAGDDTVKAASTDSSSVGNPSSKLIVNLGDGVDRLDVDLSLANEIAKVQVDGGNGSDRVHFTGTLNSDKDEASRITKSGTDGIVFQANGGHALTYTGTATEFLTDALANKKTIEVSESNGSYSVTDAADFTDYVIKVTKDKAAINAAAAKGALLSNVKVILQDQRTYFGLVGKLYEIGNIDARGRNLVIEGEEVTVAGTVQADTIIVNALSSSKERSFADTIDKIKELDIKNLENPLNQFYNRAAITLEKGSKLYAAGDIDLTAKVTQSGVNDVILKRMDPANVWVGRSVITVKNGALVAAGIDADTKEIKTSSSGSVTMNAITESKAEAGGGTEGASPIAIGVLVEDSEVTVETGAQVKAARNITLNSEGKLTIETVAQSGLDGFPIAIAVNVLKNKVVSTVNGNLEAGRTVNVTAKGVSDAKATSGKGKGQTSLSGGYFGVNVVVQDVTATIGKGADVKAGSEVNVIANAEEKATTNAVTGSAAGQNTGGSETSVQDAQNEGKTLWNQTKDKVSALYHKAKGDEKNPDEQEMDKLNKHIDSVMGSDYTLQVADDSQKKGDVNISTAKNTSGSGNIASVKVNPWPGYKVKKVWYRYFDNTKNGASSTYAIGEATYDSTTKAWKFVQSEKEMYVYVDYEEGSDDNSGSAADLFNREDSEGNNSVQQSLNDATGGSNNADDDDDFNLGEFFENKFVFQIEETETKDANNNPVGAVLNKKFEVVTEDNVKKGKSVTETALGKKVEFVINTLEGYELASGGLSVSYYVYENGQKKEISSVIEKDADGRYIFSVPENLEPEGYGKDSDGNSIGFKVKSVFEKKTSESTTKTDRTKTQVAGSIAVAVATNDNIAKIDNGSKVTAGDTISVKADSNIDINNSADGSAAAKPSASSGSSGQSSEPAEVKPETKIVSDQYIVPGNEYAVTLEHVEGGKVDVSKTENNKYTLTPKQGENTVKENVTAKVTYMKAGVSTTEDLTAEEDGSFKLDLTSYQIDKGTTARISFTMPQSSSQENQDPVSIIAHPVNVSYNALKPSAGEDPDGTGTRKIGDVKYIRTDEVKNDDGKVTDRKYFFALEPDAAVGYTIKPGSSQDANLSDKAVLWASYKTAAGEEKQIQLHLSREQVTENNNSDSNNNSNNNSNSNNENQNNTRTVEYWYVLESELQNIPSGAVITVNVRFSEDKHEVKPADLTNVTTESNSNENNHNKNNNNNNNAEPGEYDAASRHGTVTVNKTSAKTTDTITVTATPKDNYVAKKIYVSYTDENGTKQKKELTPDENGKATYALPAMKAGEKIYVDAEFGDRTIAWTKDSANADVKYPDESRRFVAGEKVTVSLTDDAVKAGKKITAITVTYRKADESTTSVTVNAADGKFTIPSDAKDNQSVSIKVVTGDKAIDLSSSDAALEHGKLTFEAKKADKGETVNVKVVPDEGYRLKDDSGKATITAGDKTWQVKLQRKDDNTCTFVIPAGIDEHVLTSSGVKVKLEGVFEEGWADSSKVKTSIGAGVAVSVVLSDNDALINGGALDAKNVKVQSSTKGSAKTSTKAGYSKSETGVSGAISVQVADFDTSALIKKDASITTNTLDVASNGTLKFDTTGDAAGNIEAGDLGIGSGIAVAVDGGDTSAGIQDGTNLIYKNGSNISSVKVTANSVTEDKMTAKAGAAGGKSATPVVAVDVAGTDTKAYLGKVKIDGKADEALKTQTVDIEAFNTATHTITADASAAGKSVALGGAFNVTVVSNEAVAELLKSITSSGAINVKSNSHTVLNATANAGVTGGLAGQAKSDGSKGSTDKQTDSILSGAQNLASRNGQSGALQGAQNRQQAQTSEGSVAGAGAVVVNVLSNSSAARIGKGVNVIDLQAQDKRTLAVNVESINRTEVNVKANASATKSDIGVGVGVAVNVVNIENVAEIGNGAFKVGSLKVRAKMPEAAKKAADTVSTDKAVGTTQEMKQQVADNVYLVVKEKMDEMGVTDAKAATIAATFVNTFLDSIFAETGLKDLTEAGTFQQKLDGANTDINNKFQSLKDLPQEILAPLKAAYDSLASSLGVTKEAWEKAIDQAVGKVEAEFATKLSSCISTTMEKAKTAMVGGVIDIINASLAEDKDAKKKAMESLSALLDNTIRSELNALADTLTADILAAAASTVDAAASQTVISSLKTAVQQAFNEKLAKTQTSISGLFKEKVFDYAKAADALKDKDLPEEAKKQLKETLKKEGVTVDNEILNYIITKLDVRLSSSTVDNKDKHVINTQAISGAGAKNVGVAGSVAITVLNEETRAFIDDPAGITDMTIFATDTIAVDAQESRRVTNIASAAVDAKGNADTNKDAAAREQQNAGSSDAAAQTITVDQDKIKVTAGAGSSISQDNEDSKKIWINLKQGYKFSDGNKASYVVTKENGDEETKEIEIKSTGSGTDTKYYIDLNSIGTQDATVNVKIEPVENLHTLKNLTTTVTDNSKTLSDNVASLKVEGRNQEVSDNSLKARAGEQVLVTIDKTKAEGLAIESVTFTGSKGSTTQVLTQKSSTAKEITYVFTMPDEDVSGIKVNFKKADTENQDSKDEKGRSVGVGASFSMVYGDTKVESKIKDRTLTGGSLYMNASSDHKEDVHAVSGTDPLTTVKQEETADNPTKDFALDAAVALNILDNSIKVEKGPEETANQTPKTSTSNPATAKVSGDSKNPEDELSFGDAKITATEKSVTNTKASAYAVGNETAVGAAVAINLASSDVDVALHNGTQADNTLEIIAQSYNEDNTHAFATAMGADIERSLKKLDKKVEKGRETTQKLVNGTLFDEQQQSGSTSNSNNGTATRINDRLNSKATENQGDKASNDLSLSSNVARTQNVKAKNGSDTNDAQNKANDTLSQNLNQKVTGQNTDTKKEDESKYQVAAAVGVTVADHAVKATMGNYVKANKDVRITAVNNGNFNTLGTGAAMSLAKEANSIAAGVAVSVNENTAEVNVKKNVVAVDGDVTMSSILTQNMDGEYRGKLAAQALAGSVSGAKSDFSVAAAVAVVDSTAKSTVDVAPGVGERHGISGNKVTISATDKSKLAVRAGGVSISNGSKVGMGLSAAAISSKNTVRASVGDNTTILAKEFDLTAKKEGVTYDDYKKPVSFSDIVTDSSKLTPEQRKKGNTGIIDIHRKTDEEKAAENKNNNNNTGSDGTQGTQNKEDYKVDININSNDLLHGVDVLNFLSSQNYYAEAIAGSCMKGTDESKFNAAASVGVIDFANTVDATLGKNVIVNIKPETAEKEDAADGSVNIEAAADTNARIIAGALSVAPSDVSVGLTVAYLGDEDVVKASTGDGTKITTLGDFTQKADVDSDVQLFTIAASVGTGSKAKFAGAGAVNVITTENKAESTLGKDVTIDSAGKADVTADTEMDLTLISASVGGAKTGAAAGGTVNVIVDEAESTANIGNGASVKAVKDVNVNATVDETLISGAGSASAALQSGNTSVAGAIGVLISESKANVNTGSNAKLNSTQENVKILADSDTVMVNAMLAAAGSRGLAVGAAVGVNVYGREAKVNLAGSGDALTKTAVDIEAAKDVLVQAKAKDTTVSAGLAMAGSTDGSALSGNIQVTVGKSKVKNTVTGGLKVKAGNNLVFDSYLDNLFVNAAGSIALSNTSAAIGATVLTAVQGNEVVTDIGSSYFEALGGGSKEGTGAKLANGSSMRGIHVGAESEETQVIAGAGVALGGKAGVTGTIVTNVNNNTVKADASQATLDTLGATAGIPVTANVKATDDTNIVLVAGGLNFGKSAGLGASAVTLVSNKTIDAVANIIKGSKGVNLNARNKDDVVMVAVSAGGGKDVAVEIGAAVQVMKSKVHATLLKEAASRKDNIEITADNTTNLVNVAAAVGGAGKAAVTPVGVVTYFQGETLAKVKENAKVGMNRGKVANSDDSMILRAKSDKDIELYSVGVAASGNLGVSGTANILVAKDTVMAEAEKGTDFNLQNATLNTLADNNYKVRSASGSIAASGEVAASVNAVVSVLKGITEARMKGTAVTKGDVNVKANAGRDVISVGATVAGAGQAAAGATVMVLVAGEKMSADAADMLVYGNSDNKSGSKTFDVDAFLDTAEEEGVDVSHLKETSLKEDLEGSKRRDSEMTVGSEQTNDKGTTAQSFDVSSYYSDDYNNNDFDDQKENQADGNTKNQDSKEEASQRGENLTADETKDAKNAKKLGEYKYESDSTDKVVAEITKEADITAANVSVLADQPTKADLYGATLAGGGMAGLGVSAAVAILRSNVIANSQGHLLVDKGKVTVKASSRSEFEKNVDEAEKARTAGVADNAGEDLKNVLDPTKRSIRVIGLTGSLGTAGLAVAASVVDTDNVTRANLGGVVDNARTVDVIGESKYDNILAGTLALSVGEIAVSASVAVAQANGDVSASIDNTADIFLDTLDESVNVVTDTTVNVNAVAAAAAAGMGAINGSVALASNRMKQDTDIYRGAKITSDGGEGSVNVKGITKTTANSYILSLSGGAVAANLAGAVTIADAKVNTGIGVKGPEDKNAEINFVNGEVNVLNDIYTKSAPHVIAASVGLGAMNGSVLLAFNETKGLAGMANTNLRVKDLTINSDLGAEGTADLTSLSVGGVAIGIGVNYVDMHADNAAKLDITDDFDVRNNLTVTTGTGKNRYSKATAKTIAATAGLLSVGVNAAVARNRTVNRVEVTGKHELATGNLTIGAKQNADTTAKVLGLNLSAAQIAASFGIALNEAESRTYLKLPSLKINKATKIANELIGTTNSSLTNGGGALLSVTTNVATAYGRTQSKVKVDLTEKASEFGTGFTVRNTPKNTVNATVDNLSGLSGVSAAAVFGSAYGQDDYSTVVLLPTDRQVYVNKGNFDVQTNYDSEVKSVVAPSNGGILASIDVNGVVAKSTVNAVTSVKGSGDLYADSILVKTNGRSTAAAKVNSPLLQANALAVNANMVNAILKTKQLAELYNPSQNSVFKTVAKNGTFVESHLNEEKMNEETGKAEDTVGAYAVMGGTGFAAGLFAVKVNLGYATADAVSTARTIGVSNTKVVPDDENGSEYTDFTVKSSGSSIAKTDIIAPQAEMTMAGVGVNDLYARANGRFESYVKDPWMADYKNLNVLTEYSAKANAKGGASKGGVKLSAASVDVNEAKATVGVEATAGLTATEDKEFDNPLRKANLKRIKGISEAINIKTLGKDVASTAKIDSGVVLSGVQIVSSNSTALQNSRQLAYVERVTMYGKDASGKTINIESKLGSVGNKANASVGASGGTDVSLMSVKENEAVADNNAIVKAMLFDMDANKANVNLTANLAQAMADTNVINSQGFSLVGIASSKTKANARGTVYAGAEIGENGMDLGKLNIKSTYDIASNAIVKANGGQVGLFKDDHNTSNADTQVNALAQLKTQGDIQAEEIDVKTTGSITSTAKAETPSWTISGGRMGVQDATAKTNAVQSALVITDGADIKATEKVSVVSEVSKSVATAIAGSPANAKSIDLVGGDTNTANSYETVSSKAEISSTGRQRSIARETEIDEWSDEWTGESSDEAASQDLVEAAKIVLGSSALVPTKSVAETKTSLGVSLKTKGNLKSTATTTDRFIANVEGLRLKAGSKGIEIKVDAATDSGASGASPGGFSASKESKSETTAIVGKETEVKDGEAKKEDEIIEIGDQKFKIDRQSAILNIGKKTSLESDGKILLAVTNTGKATAVFEKKGTLALEDISESRQPTKTYMNTSVNIADGTSIETKDELVITTQDNINSTSKVNAKSLSLGLNVDVMRGENSANATNKIDIGQNASLSSGKDLKLLAMSDALMTAESKYNNGFSFGGGSEVASRNDLTRNVTTNIGAGASLESEGALSILHKVGSADKIEASSDLSHKSATVSLGDAQSRNNVTSESKIAINPDVLIKAAKDVMIDNDGSLASVKADTEVYSGSAVAVPKAKSFANVRNNTLIHINKGTTGTVNIRSTGGNVDVLAHSELVGIKSTTDSTAGSGVGGVVAKTENTSNLKKQIWVEDTVLRADKTLTIESSNNAGGITTNSGSSFLDNLASVLPDILKNLFKSGSEKNDITTEAETSLYAATGYKNSRANSDGDMWNEIRSDKPSTVTLIGQTVKTSAIDPKLQMSQTTKNAPNWHILAVTDYSGEFKVDMHNDNDLDVGKGQVKVITGSAAFDYLDEDDESGTSGNAGGSTTPAMTPAYSTVPAAAAASVPAATAPALQAAASDASAASASADAASTADAAGGASASDNAQAASVGKGLSKGVGKEKKEKSNNGKAWRASLEEEMNRGADEIFVTDLQSMLTQDVTLEQTDLSRYLLWTNTATQRDYYMLPNAARLAMAGKSLQLVTDVLVGDPAGSGTMHPIDVVTVLAAKAGQNPVIEIGMTSSLDFSDGTLRVASGSDLDVYLNEISASWMKDRFENGFIRFLNVSPAEVEVYLEEGTALSEDNVLTGVFEDEELKADIVKALSDEASADNFKLIWLGRKPADAEDDEQALFFLLIDEEEDKATVFRTSLAMIENGEKPVASSMLVFRDDKSDRKGEEAYNIAFYDTLDGEESMMVTLMTDILSDREMDTPVALKIKLRAFTVDGSEYDAYSVSGNLFVLNDGTDGSVELFDGSYKASFDGDVFESDYTRIEGVESGSPVVTIKADQPVWPEWKSETSAEDIEGNSFELKEDGWVQEEAEETEESAEA